MLKVDWNIILNMINIIVFYILMKKFLFGPITDIMDKRANAIKDSLEQAENKNNEALQLKKQYEQELKNADEQALELIKQAKQKALEEHDKQMKATKEETAKLIEEANKAIELEKKQSIQMAQSEIAAIAMLAASKVIGKNVDDTTNKQLVDDFLSEEGAVK